MGKATLEYFHEWESTIQSWFDQSNSELVLPDTSPLDRRILVVLTVKYRLRYEDTHDSEKIERERETKKERLATIKLFKVKPMEEEEEDDDEDRSRRMGQRCQLFADLTDRSVKAAQAHRETSAEWKDFTALCDWHGMEFLRKFDQCLRQLIAECVAETAAYQKLISERPVVSPVKKIRGQVYVPKNENQIFLTIDMKSANYSILKHIGAIDGNAFPTWQDFLAIFVGARPCLLTSKKFRMRSLGLLPQYYKVEALWTQFTGTVFEEILHPYFTERHSKADCVTLEGDEVVFHLKMKHEREINQVVQDIHQQVNRNAQVIFTVQAYRLQMFHWKNAHLCFVRLFLNPSKDKFDLKCVPNKEANYEQAVADCRAVLGL